MKKLGSEGTFFFPFCVSENFNRTGSLLICTGELCYTEVTETQRNVGHKLMPVVKQKVTNGALEGYDWCVCPDCFSWGQYKEGNGLQRLHSGLEIPPKKFDY